MNGLLYYGWTTGLLYRRINDIDRFVGWPAARLAFVPKWFLKLYHPAQAVVVGSTHSGKSELVRWLPQIMPTVVGSTNSTSEPVLYSLKGNVVDDWYEVSIVDTGGEMMGDQLDLIRKVRTDCLVVVICSNHLVKNKRATLENSKNWTLENMHSLVDDSYMTGPGVKQDPTGKKTAAFFQTLYYATNRAGNVMPPVTPANPVPARPKRSAADEVATVHTVLVVLKDRDSQPNTHKQFGEVTLACLESLAQDIYRRFSRNGGNPALNAAAIKVEIQAGPLPAGQPPPPQNVLTLNVVPPQSQVLSDAAGAFKGWAYAMSGAWGEP